MNKIAIFALYFGQLPEYFPLWLRSAGRNSGIDWFLISDQNVDFELPQNVTTVFATLGQVKGIFEAHLGRSISLETAYKLCDYKPLFWLMLPFTPEREKYLYWGHCDIDTYWGDLDGFLAGLPLSSYDRVFDLGHLSIYRNSSDCNSVYELAPAKLLERVFSSSSIAGFDEQNGINRIMRRSGFRVLPTGGRVGDVDPGAKEPRALPPHLNFLPHRIWVANGNPQITYFFGRHAVHRRCVYIHFQKRKFSPGVQPASFYFDTTGIVAFSGAIPPPPVDAAKINATYWLRVWKNYLRTVIEAFLDSVVGLTSRFS